MYLYNAEYKSTLRSGDQGLGSPYNPESIMSWQLISGLSLRSWLSFCLCVPHPPPPFLLPASPSDWGRIAVCLLGLPGPGQGETLQTPQINYPPPSGWLRPLSVGGTPISLNMVCLRLPNPQSLCQETLANSQFKTAASCHQPSPVLSGF